MWALIMMTAIHYGQANAVLPGFKSEDDCKTAGVKWEQASKDLRPDRPRAFTCLHQPR